MNPFLWAFICLYSFCLAAKTSNVVTGHLSYPRTFVEILTPGSVQEIGMKVFLHGDRELYQTLVLESGSFQLEVPIGIYNVEIVSRNWTFPRLSIDVGGDHVRAWNTMNHHQLYPYPLEIQALSWAMYFEVQRHWNLQPLSCLDFIS
jgi:hypothetical protein